MDKTELIKKIEEIITPILDSRGIELVDIDYVPTSEGKTLKIYIDKNSGVTLKDCEDVTVVLNVILDEHNIISEDYLLEVSSPGIYRELKKEKDFMRYINNRIKVKLYEPIKLSPSDTAGQKIFLGKLVDFQNNTLKLMLENGSIIEIDRTKIAKANLEPDIKELMGKLK